MATQREKTAAWLERRRGPRDRPIERALLRAAAAFDRAAKARPPSSRDLGVIVAASSSSRALLWCNAVGYLGWLSGRRAGATDAIVRMSTSTRAHVRHAALQAVAHSKDVEAVNDLIRRALIDRSKRVRARAAELALRRSRRELLTELDAAHGVERDPGTRGEMKFAIDLLRDGYQARREGDGAFVWLPTPDGIEGRHMTRDELRERGIRVPRSRSR